MKSMISSSGILAAALCATLLAGCSAVESVNEEPSAALPEQSALLAGRIKDLGTRRPLVLQYNGTDTCLVPVNPADPNGRKVVTECAFLGVPDQEFSLFSFGGLTVGTAYNITVKKQPFGKICTVQNPNGTVAVAGAQIEVTCVDDPAVTHNTVTVDTSAVAGKSGLRVILTTENGTCPVSVDGRTSITFSPTECPDSATSGYHRNATYTFDNGLSLPHFPWQVTATIPGATATSPPINCFVTGGPVANTGGNVSDTNEVDPADRPTGDVSVTVQSCGFTVRAQADYSRPPGVTTTPAIAVGDGITVALRSQPWGEDVASVRITSFANSFVPFMVPDANGDPTATQYEAQSDPNAFYELVVTQSPAGMSCMPGSSTSSSAAPNSTRAVGNWTDAGAVLLRNPASSYQPNVWLIDRVIRCRLIPADPATQLRGSYWQSTTTTTTNSVGSGPLNIVPVTVRNRNVLTFFEDGQYLYGNHVASASNNGVEQGFYHYDPVAQTIVLTGITDTNGAQGLHVVSTGGSAVGAPVARTMPEVVRAPGSITTRITNTTTTGLVLSSGSLTVAVGTGLPFNVASGTYVTANFANLVAAINAVPGAAGIAAANGGEITITAPAGQSVTFGGGAAVTLGMPITVPAGTSATSTAVANTLDSTQNVTVDWVLEEVGPDPMVTSTNALDGAWVLWDATRQPAPVEDRRRIFVYQHGLYTALHIGVNGIANLQEACYVGNFGLSGTWTRQGGRSGCNMRTYTLAAGETIQQVVQAVPSCSNTALGEAGLASTCALLSSGSADIPNATTALKDYPGRWPQSQNPDFTDGRPYSLVEFEVRLAGADPADPVCPNLDKLTVWDTQHGVRKSMQAPPIPPVVMCRMTAN